MSGGHVFVVRGRLENLDCDAVLIPTSLEFGVRPIWASALGVRERQRAVEWHPKASRAKPEGWKKHDGWGKAKDGALPYARQTWFIDSTRRGDLAGMSSRLEQTLEDIANARLSPANKRPRPLVALPVLGVGHGGFGDELRGEALRKQLEICLDAVHRFELDVVIVAFVPSDYAAIQTLRRDNDLYIGLPESQRQSVVELAGKVRKGTLAVLLGAGVSMSAGLPSWTELLEQLDEPAGVGFDGLDSVLDKAQLLRKRLGDGLGKKVSQIVGGHQCYGLSHALLAALDCPHAVTTNYDQLYERAFADGHRSGAELHVLPHGTPEPGTPWLVKMHGDVEHPKDIVLARSDFVGYSAKSGPVGAVVQSLLMTEHLLVVGASMSDDNFLRLAHEVLAFRSHNLGTVLKFSVTNAERELWGNEFTFVEVSAGGSAGERARRLAILLDVLAMEAAQPHHLLDERYEKLLTPEESALSEKLRGAADAVASLQGDAQARWSGIGTVLQLYGYRAAEGPGTSDSVRPVIVRFVMENSDLASGARLFLVEVPSRQVPETWPVPGRSNESREALIGRYLKRVADLAQSWPGAVTPGHVSCLVNETGQVVSPFHDPEYPYANLWNGSSPLRRLGVLVPNVASVAKISLNAVMIALRQDIGSLECIVPPGWEGTELARTSNMHEAMERWEALERGRTDVAVGEQDEG